MEKEDFLVALVCVHPFSPPKEYWEEETIEGIVNVIENFVKISKATKSGGTLHMHEHVFA